LHFGGLKCSQYRQKYGFFTKVGCRMKKMIDMMKKSHYRACRIFHLFFNKCEGSIYWEKFEAAAKIAAQE
jgi:hypothetical protein